MCLYTCACVCIYIICMCVCVCIHAQRLFNVASDRMGNHNHGYMSYTQWMTLMKDQTNDLVPDIVSLETLRRVFINSKMDFLQVGTN